MAFAVNVAYLRGWLVVFNALLAAYCVAIDVLVLRRPCYQVCEARGMSTLEMLVLAFHFAAAVAMSIGCGGLCASHSRLIQANRVVLALFTVCYLVFGVWELLEVTEYPVVGALTLFVGLLVLAFGAAPSLCFERLRRRQLAVAPEDSNFHSVWSSSQPPPVAAERSASTGARAPNPRTLAAW